MTTPTPPGRSVPTSSGGLAGDSLFKLAVEAAPVGVLIVGPGETIVLVNRSLEQLFGYTQQELIGQPVETLLVDSLHSIHRSHRLNYSTHPETRRMGAGRELFGQRKDGSRIPVEIGLNAIRTEEGLFVLAFVADVSERRRSETAHERDIKERLEFERLVADLSAAFVNLSADTVDQAIEDAQRRVCECLDLDRSTLFELSDANDDLILTHNWGRRDQTPPPRVTLSQSFPWSLAKVRAGEPACFSSPDEVPDLIERESLRIYGTLSRAAFPISIGGRVVAVISFAAVHKPRQWPPETLARLQLLAQVFAGALARKQADLALRASEERFRTLADTAPVLIWVSGRDKLCTWFNRQWLDFVGQTMAHELGDGWTRGVHPDDVASCLHSYTTAFDARRPFTMEYRLRRHDGVWRWIRDNGTPNYAADGTFAGYLGSCVDVTDMKEATLRLQDALMEVRHAEDGTRAQLARLELLHRITQSIGGREEIDSIYEQALRDVDDSLGFALGCICGYDAAQRQLTVLHIADRSRPLAIDLSVTEQTAIDVDANDLGRCLSDQLVYEPDVSVVDSPFLAALARAGLGSFVAAPLRAEESVFGVFMAVRRERRGFSSGDCEFIQSLTEHVALAAHQAQLRSALQRAYEELRDTQQSVIDQERLRALGQMASGIAHDVNNALSPASLYTEAILEDETGLSAEAREYLRTIQRAIDDVGQTLDRLRQFSRQHEPTLTLKPVNLNALAEDVQRLTRARWSDMAQLRGTVIEMQLDLAPDVPTVMGVESEIRSALTNLVFNAVDAMPLGGTLTIRTRAGTRPAADGAMTPTAQIELADTGVGMSPDTQRRCLEPFFTTKGDRGTGLGLAMVYGVAQRHHAEFEIESALGAGTTVRLSFPTQMLPMVEAIPSARSEPVPSRLRVLVIDDNPAFTRSLRDILERDGQAVATALGGKEGIESFHDAASQGAPFDVVITDLGMPHVDGRKVAAAIKAASPFTPVILLTGWGRRLVDEDRSPHVDRVLSKPPRLQELRASLTWAASLREVRERTE